MEMAFFVIINELLRDKVKDHGNLEFHIVHSLEPAPQTQTATAHLQTTWTVYFDGQGTQKLPCGKIPQYRLAHGPLYWQLTVNFIVGCLQFGVSQQQSGLDLFCKRQYGKHYIKKNWLSLSFPLTLSRVFKKSSQHPGRESVRELLAVNTTFSVVCAILKFSFIQLYQTRQEMFISWGEIQAVIKAFRASSWLVFNKKL